MYCMAKLWLYINESISQSIGNYKELGNSTLFHWDASFSFGYKLEDIYILLDCIPNFGVFICVLVDD